MTVAQQITAHISSLPEAKRAEMQSLHKLVLKAMPRCKLWFDTGKNSEGKTVANPTIGYGLQTLKYADGNTKEYFKIGLSANASGFSVYILGLKDKDYLAKNIGKELGKAKVTGYCIRFKSIQDLDAKVLASIIQEVVAQAR